MCENTLKGKRIAFLGSSVTYGWASGGASFVELLAQREGIVPFKYAESGTTLSSRFPRSYGERLREVAQRELDAFVCQLSTNDATKNVEWGGSKDDTRCVLGAISDIVSYVTDRWRCPILLFSNPYFENAAYERMVSKTAALSREMGFAFLDLYRDDAFNAVGREERARYMADDIHPTIAGYEWCAPRFAAALKLLLN